MQGGSDHPAHVLKDAKGRIVAVLAHYSDAVQVVESHRKPLTRIEEPGLLDFIEEICARPRIGEKK